MKTPDRATLGSELKIIESDVSKPLGFRMSLDEANPWNSRGSVMSALGKSQCAIIRITVLACLIIEIHSTNAFARETASSQSSSSDLWAPYLLFNGGLSLSDRSEFEIDGFHVGLATFWSLLTIADTSQVRVETMLGLDVIGGSWGHKYLFGLGADCGAALRVGPPSIGFFAMATWLPSILAIQPASANTHTTPLGYRLLIGMSWYRNNFGVGWRSIGRKSGFPYRALEAFFGLGF